MENLLLLSDGVKEVMEEGNSMKVMDGLAEHMLNVKEDIASWQTSTQDGYENGLIFFTGVGFDDEEEKFFSITSIATILEVISSINYTPAVGDFCAEDEDGDDWEDILDSWEDNTENE